MFGFTTLQPNQFSIDRQLRDAFVNAELTLDGFRCVFTEDVNDPFSYEDGDVGECESFTANVTVSVTSIEKGESRVAMPMTL